MMVALGGFVRGSATILWSMIAPLAALLVTSRRRAAYWFLGFVVLLLFSAVLESYISTLPPVNPIVQTIFFVMNILGPWTAAFVILSSFWLEKETNSPREYRASTMRLKKRVWWQKRPHSPRVTSWPL